jgi:hypothetical protein
MRRLSGRFQIVFYHRKLFPADAAWINCSHTLSAFSIVLFYFISACEFCKDIEQALTAAVTGANAHDSQLAIPMEQLTEMNVPFCYSFTDSAYDSKVIDEFIRSHRRIPVIDPNKRKDNGRPPLDPAKKERHKIQTTVGRANPHLKDRLIPRSIYVKGYSASTQKISIQNL